MDQSYMLPEETRITGAAKLVLRGGGVAEVRFVPAWVGEDSAPEFVRAEDARFRRVRAYLEEVSRAEGLATRFEVDGDELVLSAAD
jgi:poly-gamma-glutamate synthesis protein (capsule biosynthesis protein)